MKRALWQIALAKAAAPQDISLEDVDVTVDLVWSHEGKNEPVLSGCISLDDLRFENGEDSPLKLSTGFQPTLLATGEGVGTAFAARYAHEISVLRADLGLNRRGFAPQLPCLKELQVHVSLLHRDGRLLTLASPKTADLFYFNALNAGEMNLIFDAASLRSHHLMADYGHTSVAVTWYLEMAYVLADEELGPRYCFDMLVHSDMDEGVIHANSLRAALVQAPWVLP